MAQLSPARKMALEVTAAVRMRNAYAHNLIDSRVNTSSLNGSDKSFASLLILGVVSTSGTLDYIINRNLNRPTDVRDNVRDALRISVYELVALEKEPPIVIDQGVELVKSIASHAGGLANAVLRKVARDIKGFPWGDPAKDDRALAVRYGFPQWLTERLIEELGREAAERFMRTSNEPPPLYIAVNAVKANDAEVLRMLNGALANASFTDDGPIGCIKAENSANALRSPALRKGYALICDASAQTTAHVARFMPRRTYLEVGSGRGTKTILLQSFAKREYGEQATIYALDKHAYKEEVATKRGQLYGLQNVVQVTGDALELDRLNLPRRFDGAFIDAPCSGIGTLRRHPEIRWRVTPQSITGMADLGYDILCSVASHIAYRGSIVYSTCTVTHEENEDVIQRFLDTSLGSQFFIQPIEQCRYVSVPLDSKGPDAHFVVRLMRRG